MSITKKVLLLILLMATFQPVQAKPEIQESLSVSHETLQKDLETMLITHNQIVGEIRRDNLSLFDAALEYRVGSAWMDFLSSMVVSFLVIKNPAQTLTLYISNLRVISNAIKAKKALSRLKLGGPTAATIVPGLIGSAALSSIYIATSLFHKGVCIFSCVDAFSDRVLEQREQEFLTSETYKTIENEIGKEKALRYFSILKTMRDGNFTDFTPVINFLKHDMNEWFVRDIYDYSRDEAPVFSQTIQIIAKTFNLHKLVYQYIKHQEAEHKETCPTPQSCT